jgi:hypothetical protein
MNSMRLASSFVILLLEVLPFRVKEMTPEKKKPAKMTRKLRRMRTNIRIGGGGMRREVGKRGRMDQEEAGRGGDDFGISGATLDGAGWVGCWSRGGGSWR